MPRGGTRPGAGRKPRWKSGKTVVIRVPEVFADEIMETAVRLDNESSKGSVTQSEDETVTESKVLDLSGILIRSFAGQPAILLSDLVRAGYRLLPDRVMDSIVRRAEPQQEREDELKELIESHIEQLSLFSDEKAV